LLRDAPSHVGPRQLRKLRASFNIKNDVGTVIGHVELTGNNVYGDFIPISLDTPVLTSYLTFELHRPQRDRSTTEFERNARDHGLHRSGAVHRPALGTGGLLVAWKIKNQTSSQPKGRNNMHKSIKFGIIGGALLVAGLFVTTTPVLAAVVTGNLSIEAKSVRR